MHIADEILKEVEENKIVDIFSEPEKTKVFLQLKELELIRVSESGVFITEEGKKARKNGLKLYFSQKRKEREELQEYEVAEIGEPENTAQTPAFAIPLIILLLFVLLGLFLLIRATR